MTRLPKPDLKQMIAVRTWLVYFATTIAVISGGIAEDLSFWPQLGVCAGGGFIIGFVYSRTSRKRGVIMLGLSDDEQQNVAARIGGADE